MVDRLLDQRHHRKMTSSRWESLDEVIADRTKLPLDVLREVSKYQRYLAAIERRTVQAARRGTDLGRDRCCERSDPTGVVEAMGAEPDAPPTAGP